MSAKELDDNKGGPRRSQRLKAKKRVCYSENIVRGSYDRQKAKNKAELESENVAMYASEDLPGNSVSSQEASPSSSSKAGYTTTIITAELESENVAMYASEDLPGNSVSSLEASSFSASNAEYTATDMRSLETPSIKQDDIEGNANYGPSYPALTPNEIPDTIETTVADAIFGEPVLIRPYSVVSSQSSSNQFHSSRNPFPPHILGTIIPIGIPIGQIPSTYLTNHNENAQVVLPSFREAFGRIGSRIATHVIQGFQEMIENDDSEEETLDRGQKYEDKNLK